MIIIGERINATRKNIAAAMERKDAEFIKNEALRQSECGANYIDLNAGLGKGREREDLTWLINTVQSAGDFPLCLDSSDPAVLEACLPLVKNPDRMINSINGETKRIENLLPVIKKNADAKVIALTMDDDGIPCTAEKRVEIGISVIKLLVGGGVQEENIFVDALVQPVSVDQQNAVVYLNAVKELKRLYPKVRATCGLSNVSFGLPRRKLINQYFISVAIYAGLDSAIIDPLDAPMREAICVTEMVAGKDEYCMNYIQYARALEASRFSAEHDVVVK